jgi:hypothetical protein
MTIELEDNLIIKYRPLFKNKDDDMISLIGCFGFECGNGWYKLIDDTLNKINQKVIELNIKYFEIVQIKQKFGSLRIYTNFHIEEIEDIIEDAEDLSKIICEGCGKSGKLRNDGYLMILCDKCYKIFERRVYSKR